MSTPSFEPDATAPTVTTAEGIGSPPGSSAADRTARSTRSSPEPNASSRPLGPRSRAVVTRIASTCARVSEGLADRTSAAPAVTKAAAIEVPSSTTPPTARLGGDHPLAGGHEVDEAAAAREARLLKAPTDARDPENPRVGRRVDRRAARLATVPRGGDHRDPLVEGVADRVCLERALRLAAQGQVDHLGASDHRGADRRERCGSGREEMVREQIAERGLRDPRLLEAFRRVPRHLFIPPHLRERAYWDGPLPIGGDQTISQPYIVAYMTSLLGLKGDETVLEVGTGSGYQAAVLSCLARRVITIERLPELSARAGSALKSLGYDNIILITGDGSLGWPDAAPYQGILVTAAAPRVPDPLQQQLAEGGRLVAPVGGRQGQELQLWEKRDSRLTYESILPVSFVPLRGDEGWKEDWM